MKRIEQANKTIINIKKRIMHIKGKSDRCYMYLINKILGVNDHKVVFISFGGKSYSDNPRAISEKMHQMQPDFEIVWLFKNPEEKRKIVPGYVRCVKAGSYRALKEMATAKFWVDNFSKTKYVYKGSNQFYIQTWHGDRGFKKVLYDLRTLLPNGHYKEGDLVEPKICDLAVSGSEFGNRVYKTAFGYSGEVYTYGSPRNDQLIIKDSCKVDAIKESLKINQATKVLLYAPTFRDSKRNERQSFGGLDLIEVLHILEKKTKENWICLVRSHSVVSGFEEFISIDKIIDVTSYEDMSDLLLISDLLITDYSSSAGDFALLNKPVILFQNDIESYIKYDRDFYFNINESPYMVANDQNDLVKIIEEMDWDNVPQNCKEILDFYGTFETGKASEKVVGYILSKQKLTGLDAK